MPPVKILLVSNMYPGKKQVYFGAFIKNIEEGLTENGALVDRIVIQERGKNFIHVILKYLFFYAKLLLVDLSKYDFVQVSYPSHSYLPFFFKRMKKCKMIVRLHGYDLLSRGPLAILFKEITKKAVMQADLTVVPSNFFYKELEKVVIPKDYYIYPSGGVDITKFFDIAKEDNVFTMGFVGWLLHGKGADVLIESLTYLRDLDCKCVLVGDGNMKDKLVEYAKDLGVEDKVQFAGSIANNQLVKFYNEFDVFVFPTREKESFGNVAIEAMACKVPVIGSNRGALPDYIYDGENGYLFEPGNAEDLAIKIRSYYDLSLNEKRKMQDCAFKVSGKYEKKLVSTQFISKLESIRG